MKPQKMDEQRLVQHFDEWRWVCPVCDTVRPVSEHRSCGNCGKDSLKSAGRRLGAAQRNFGVAFQKSMPLWLRRLLGKMETFERALIGWVWQDGGMTEPPRIPEDRASSWIVDENAETGFIVVNPDPNTSCDDFDPALIPPFKDGLPLGGVWTGSGEPDDFTVAPAEDIDC